ncbi:MAG TPA: cupin domain-containing protein [Actinomycetes bacterium]|nr:cupin domain-containing protein [Actinomycetes bacterium]
MQAWTVSALRSTLQRSHGDGGEPWLEFQRSPDLSTGLYVLAAGETDHQLPHSEDEVYVAVSGGGRFVTPSGAVDVAPGTVIFVPAHEEHRFVDISEDLTLVVVFGPAEGSRA